MKPIDGPTLASDLKAITGAIQVRASSGFSGLIGTALKDVLMALAGDPALQAEVLALINGQVAATPTPTALPATPGGEWPPQP